MEIRPCHWDNGCWRPHRCPLLRLGEVWYQKSNVSYGLGPRSKTFHCRLHTCSHVWHQVSPSLNDCSVLITNLKSFSYVPLVVFWVIQVYTVYYASFKEAGTYLLPIGFCIAGGAVLSAVLMSVFKNKVPVILIIFCIIQPAGNSTTDHILSLSSRMAHTS